MRKCWSIHYYTENPKFFKYATLHYVVIYFKNPIKLQHHQRKKIQVVNLYYNIIYTSNMFSLTRAVLFSGRFRNNNVFNVRHNSSHAFRIDISRPLWKNGTPTADRIWNTILRRSIISIVFSSNLAIVQNLKTMWLRSYKCRLWSLFCYNLRFNRQLDWIWLIVKLLIKVG